MLQRALRAISLCLVLTLPVVSSAYTIDFEDVGANLPIAGNLYYSGQSALPGPTDFGSGGASFHNEFTDFGGGCCWQGFAYSQTTDTTTSGPANQYSAFPGSGAGGSPTYGVGFTGGADGGGGISTIDFGGEVSLGGAWITNTTWAVLSMQNGDAFAKKFGGVSGNDPDWMELTVTGLDGLGMAIGSVVFALADFRFADNGLDYIVEDWSFVDLSGLGPVHGLDFSMSSSDASFGFLNTPAYFGLDDLQVVPEPGSGALLALGIGALAARRKRMKQS
jgi:hypothetical protein